MLFNFCICSIDYNYVQIFTSCYNGFIRKMEAECEIFELIHSSEAAIYSLAQNNGNKNLYFAEGSGWLSSFDIRRRGLTDEWSLHKSRINTIDFNPMNPHIMSTCSKDDGVSIWDLRFVASNEPKPLSEHLHSRSAESAYFSPSGKYLATTEYVI